MPEVYGTDAPTILGYLAATTERVKIAAGVLPVYTRSAALIAQTAAGLDELSGGRALLGLGTSGPQVVEGLHGVSFERPLAHLRETIDICRRAWRGERVSGEGPRPVPLPGGRGKALKLIGSPRKRIPIAVAALRPAAVALTAELADAWYPLFFAPEVAREVWGAALTAGRAGRDPDLPPLATVVGMAAAIGSGEEIAAARAAIRQELALYVGGMGSRAENFYAETVSRMGFSHAVPAIQDTFLSGDRASAASAIPDGLIESVSLVGSSERVRARIEALRGAAVDTIVVRALGGDPEIVVERLAALL